MDDPVFNFKFIFSESSDRDSNDYERIKFMKSANLEIGLYPSEEQKYNLNKLTYVLFNNELLKI